MTNIHETKEDADEKWYDRTLAYIQIVNACYVNLAYERLVDQYADDYTEWMQFTQELRQG